MPCTIQRLQTKKNTIKGSLQKKKNCIFYDIIIIRETHAHTHFELVKSNSNFVFYQININQSEFTYWKVEICKKNKRKWIYEIVTSVFDTHPPYTYVTISSSKEIMFWNRYPPTFWSNVTKYAVFFLKASLSSFCIES